MGIKARQHWNLNTNQIFAFVLYALHPKVETELNGITEIVFSLVQHCVWDMPIVPVVKKDRSVCTSDDCKPNPTNCTLSSATCREPVCFLVRGQCFIKVDFSHDSLQMRFISHMLPSSKQRKKMLYIYSISGRMSNFLLLPLIFGLKDLGWLNLGYSHWNGLRIQAVNLTVTRDYVTYHHPQLTVCSTWMSNVGHASLFPTNCTKSPRWVIYWLSWNCQKEAYGV